MKVQIIIAGAAILLSFSPLPQSPVAGSLPAFAAGPKAAAKSLLEQANQKYAGKQYLEAYTLYNQAISKEKAGPVAWLYMGHCALALGHTQEAAKIYQTVVNNFPMATEAQTAATYYGKCVAAAPAATVATATPAGRAGADGDTPAPGALSAGPTNAANVATLLGRIQLVKPVFGHPNLDKLTINTVHEDIENLPQSVVKLLVKGKIKFCVTPSLIDRNPELGYQEGRGYDGATYKKCPGMFDGQTVVLCEHTVDEATNDFEPQIMPSELNQTFYHEIGHALDACLGEYSHSPEYRHNYYLDIARIPQDAASRLAYYMQKSDAGQEESCGEISAVALGGATRNAEDVKAYFPLTLAFVKQKLGLK